MTVVRSRSGCLNICLVAQVARVEHDRREAGIGGLPQQVDVGDVIQVKCDIDVGEVSNSPRGSRDRTELTAVEAHGVLADLQDDSTAGGFGPGDDRLSVFQRDDVERRDR